MIIVSIDGPRRPPNISKRYAPPTLSVGEISSFVPSFHADQRRGDILNVCAERKVLDFAWYIPPRSKPIPVA